MKLPRDVDSRQLIKALAKLGYRITRQNGSHIRLTCGAPTPHSLTVPDHHPIKPGALNGILATVSAHHRIDKTELIGRLFD
ncbi:type II toxin-antitoxin system HicA family toxin [Dyella sp.]|jgi:predicted RNA binding protein YcfA (HicA-like mRNA interferase family)|uniref:type II toxin-antitoxin system HicA family toxin n=1 Tax=Dyella sp. TaxID=1869338 RepID=UPI002D7949BB|nr:type II toxin-antitoxin system HicA family toxin [Dyella sp.]HET7333142.1 type II toxin-antitoxin system HicA family toxin [Dyella sp.]